MPIAFAAPALTNTTQIAGFQGDVRTAALSNGGYVSAWESGISGTYTVYFQRHDALGNRVGAATEVVTAGSIENQLYDIAVADNGTFSILTRGRIGNLFSDQRLVVQSFFETTGGPTAAPAVLNTAGLSPNGFYGGQLLVNPAAAGSLIVAGLAIDGGFNNDLVRAVVTTAGVISSAPSVVHQNFAGSPDLVEMVGAPNGTEFTVTSSSIVGTGGTLSLGTNLKDMISIAPGVVVTASNIAASSEVTLTMLSGNDSAIVSYGLSGQVAGTLILGGTVTGSQSFATELVDLGGGRILIVWVADSGDSFNVNAHTDGVYAQVYNTNDGAAEGNATLIRGFGKASNDGLLADIDISADLMADGRVALGLSYPNGLTGQDVFSTVLDPRNAGVTVVSSPTVAETFVGTEFDDTFTGISTGDRIFGGAGVDTVAFFGGSSNATRSVDLQTPGSFPSNNFVLSGIENLTGTNGGDLFRGDGAANLLSGLSGNDSLYGRDGNDSLLGEAGDDLLSGGNGGDLLVGSTGNDTLSGGAGDDLMFGDSGDDILRGGAGDDEMWGGDGLDTIRADVGADLVYGGADNDIILAHAGVGLVDGGTGTDTNSCGL
jgi:Ca2+-binding RTX toxin-like protein